MSFAKGTMAIAAQKKTTPAGTLPPPSRRAAMGAKIKSHKREGRSSVRAACGTRLAEGTFGIIVLPRRVLGSSTHHRGEGHDSRDPSSQPKCHMRRVRLAS